jgi:BMFP domain-containing protein YqiC
VRSGAARTAGEEAKTAAQARVRAMIADMDLAGRDEVEALKALAVSALEKVEALEKRVAELEAADRFWRRLTSCYSRNC